MLRLLLMFVLMTVTLSSFADGADWPRIISVLERQTRSDDNRKKLAIAYNNYGIELSNQESWSEAEKKLEKALALDRRNETYKQNLAMVYLSHAFELSQERRSSGYTSYMHRDAKKLAEKAIRNDRKLVAAYVLLGDIEYENQRLLQAKSAWSRAQSLDSSQAGIKERMKKLKAEYSIERQFDRTGNSYFDLRYQENINRSAASELAKTLNQARRDVGRDLNYRPRHKIVVLIYSEESFAKVRSGPDWVGGIYDGKIRVPLPNHAAGLASVKPILYHEYTHAVIHDMTDNQCPVWLNEGIAEYEESKLRTPSLELLRIAARINRLVPLADLDDGFQSPDHKVAGLAYQQSYSIVYFLAKKYGFYRVRRLLEELGKSVSFEDALKQEFRLSVTQLETRWKRWLPSFVR
jgi:tetratricopeptide (TPR) repeat protein